jgi:hypothetical protein
MRFPKWCRQITRFPFRRRPLIQWGIDEILGYLRRAMLPVRQGAEGEWAKTAGTGIGMDR